VEVVVVGEGKRVSLPPFDELHLHYQSACQECDEAQAVVAVLVSQIGGDSIFISYEQLADVEGDRIVAVAVNSASGRTGLRITRIPRS
jgi:hypothetical protein